MSKSKTNITLEKYLNVSATKSNGQLESINILPFVHTTSFSNFREMIERGKVIDPAKSKGKKKEIYFFYGNALYIHPDHDKIMNDILIENEPVTFLFEINTLEGRFKSFFPFDTGNINRHPEKYTELVGRDIRGEFKVENIRGDTFKAFIYAFFGNNQQYIRNNPKPYDALSSDESCIEPYIGLINTLKKIFNHMELVGDHRARTLEITTDEIINLYEVKRVFVPEKSMTNLKNLTFLDKGTENVQTGEDREKTKLIPYTNASYKTPLPTKNLYVMMQNEVKSHVEGEYLEKNII